MGWSDLLTAVCLSVVRVFDNTDTEQLILVTTLQVYSYCNKCFNYVYAYSVCKVIASGDAPCKCIPAICPEIVWYKNHKVRQQCILRGQRIYQVTFSFCKFFPVILLSVRQQHSSFYQMTFSLLNIFFFENEDSTMLCEPEKYRYVKTAPMREDLE